MTPLTLLLAAEDAQLAAAAAAAVRQMRGWRLERAGGGGLVQLRATARGADAVVAELDPRTAGAVEEFQRLAASLPDRRVIVAAPAASAEDLRRLFRAGAADVVTAPFGAEALLASLEQLRQSQAPAAIQGRVIAVLKAAGGAGATTFAANLAGLLATSDLKRNRPGRLTALLDLDLQFGDADVVLDLQPKSGLADVLRTPERLDARFLSGVMTDHASGLRLLAAPSALLPADALSPDLAETLIDLACDAYERVVVDLPMAWTDWTLRVLARSDLAVLVAPPTVAGAMGARRALDALAAAGVEGPVLLALNRVNGLLDAHDKPQRIGKALEAAVELVLPNDPYAERASEAGRLVVEAFPKRPIAKALRSAVEKLETRIERLETPAVKRAAEVAS